MDPHVLGLLEEMLDTGKTPEEVCRSCPELLPELRERWQEFRRIDAEVGAWYPEPGTSPDADVITPVPLAASLPQVPGYDVEAVLGRGGMGVVYRARHLRLNRPVALKMLIAGAYAGPNERARFQREAEAVAGVRHANVIQVFDVGDHEGCPYFTMELLEGGSLARSLAGTPQPGCQAGALLAVLAAAVQVAHRAGIVHRDLKPANILLAADGTPKVADFGLARHFDEGPVLSLSGTRIGTPSYMAPEQVIGRAGTIGPAVDIYALGALLYEMLTGRPPFRGETATETERQVVAEEPVPPSRLNPKVPRDLETIALKCLEKDPKRRYADAASLADDLGRFREGRPILARPLGWGGRSWRWVRRNPAAAALVAMAMALLGLVTGGGLWLERQRAAQRAEMAHQQGRTWQAVEAALDQAAALLGQGRSQEAKAVLAAAPSLSGTPAPASLSERMRRARGDTDTAAELEEIRLGLSEGWRSDKKAAPAAVQLYPAAFRRYGIDLSMQRPAEAAALVRRSAIRDTLLVYLHDWLHWVPIDQRGGLGALLNLADDDEWRRAYREAREALRVHQLPDKDESRRAYREAQAAKDVGRLKELAGAPGAPDQSPVILSGLGGTLLANDLAEEAAALLREAQRRHPGDFWINYLLGHFLEQERPYEAVGYFRAAVAVRPRSDQAHALLGRALRGMGDADGALAALRESISLNPTPVGIRNLARALAPAGRLEEVRVVWEKLLKDDPPDHDSWHGYAQLCLFLGNQGTYRRARAALLDRFADRPVNWIVAERTAVACLLLPLAGDELRRAASLADRAVADASRSPQPDNHFVRFAAGLSEYRQGHPDKAVPLLQDAALKLGDRAGPRLVLAMAQFRSGFKQDARKTLATALRSHSWRASGDELVWVSHVLLREAEALILPDVPPFHRGAEQPREDDERLALVGICRSRALYHAAARLFTDGFAADPRLADDLTADCLRRAARAGRPADRTETLRAECRYVAARCAALAGCGLGNDGTEFGDMERALWRRQACEWLRADLAAWAKAADGESRMAGDLARGMLTLWQTDPDLAGLREPAELKERSADERKDCLELWDEVARILSRARVSY